MSFLHVNFTNLLNVKMTRYCLLAFNIFFSFLFFSFLFFFFFLMLSLHVHLKNIHFPPQDI